MENRVKESYPYKHNDERSMFYPVNTLREKNLQYFDLKKIINVDKKVGKLINKYIDVFIINLEKNVGKTYWLINEMNTLVERTIKNETLGKVEDTQFVYMFRSDAIMKIRKSEINSDDLYNFYIKGNTIFSKGSHNGYDEKSGEEIFKDRGIIVGTVVCFQTMGNWSSGQFNNAVSCYYDEYRSKKNLDANTRNLEFTRFLTFISNFQRSKPNVKFYLFGNNEPGADDIAEGFEIDKSTDYMIDLEDGLMYINLDGAFSGIEKSKNIAVRLARHSRPMQEFMVSNVAMESVKGMERQNFFKDATPWGFFFLENVIYEILIKESLWLVRSVDEYTWSLNKDGLCTLGYLTKDIVFSPRIIPTDESFIRTLLELYRFDKMKFWAMGDRANFSRLWDSIVPQINYDDIGEE